MICIEFSFAFIIICWLLKNSQNSQLWNFWEVITSWIFYGFQKFRMFWKGLDVLLRLYFTVLDESTRGYKIPGQTQTWCWILRLACGPPHIDNIKAIRSLSAYKKLRISIGSFLPGSTVFRLFFNDCISTNKLDATEAEMTLSPMRSNHFWCFIRKLSLYF